MSHILLVLPDPDWIQLSNVYMKFHRHMFTEAYTLTTISGKLDRMPANSKIHIIGHGDEKGPVIGGKSLSVNVVGDALRASKMPDNPTSIRLDTCSSAAKASGGNFSQLLLQDLQKGTPKYTKIRVEGTIGASITGFKEGREVIDPNSIDMAEDAQEVMEILYMDEIQEATRLAGTWSETLFSGDIRMLAFNVHLKTDEFFKSFRKYLINFGRFSNTSVLLNKKTSTYKKSYS